MFDVCALQCFMNSFSDNSDMKKQVELHGKLELSAFLIISLQGKEADDDRLLWRLVRCLAKSCYYLSLILQKAVKYHCIEASVGRLDELAKLLGRFGFETGVPLIKTMKANNQKGLEYLGK